MSTPEEQDQNRGVARRMPPIEHRFKPGQSGNPGGRPKGTSITAELRSLLQQEHSGKAIATLVAERLLKEALGGRHNHIQILLDRTEGSVQQQLRVQAGTAPGITAAQVLQVVIQAVPEQYHQQVVGKVRALVQGLGPETEP